MGGASYSPRIANEKEGIFYGQLCTPMERRGRALPIPPSRRPGCALCRGGGRRRAGQAPAALTACSGGSVGVGKGARCPLRPWAPARKPRLLAMRAHGVRTARGRSAEATGRTPASKGRRKSRPAVGFCGLAGDPGAAGRLAGKPSVLLLRRAEHPLLHRHGLRLGTGTERSGGGLMFIQQAVNHFNGSGLFIAA